ncbi:MAG: hypothetical protein AN485_07475 [Anabaena sp. MDT14b]|jgi:hypothetical protein|nr:MAG: hypothetical protein AN485_07475 [Anabaena sp. MDT14b]
MLNTIAKRIQSRLNRLGVKVSLGDIKGQCEKISDLENPTEVELLAVQEYFMNNATTLTVVNETVEELSTEVDNVDSLKTAGDDLVIATQPNPAPLATSNKGELVTATATQMGIVLNASEISLIAENISHFSDDFDQDIDAIKSAIMAFVQHKAMVNQSKINQMIGEVREVVGAKNNENSQLLSDGLRSINSDIQEANKQFKSNVKQCLSAFDIPALKSS